jgi:hypothetical protein
VRAAAAADDDDDEIKIEWTKEGYGFIAYSIAHRNSSAVSRLLSMMFRRRDGMSASL